MKGKCRFSKFHSLFAVIICAIFSQCKITPIFFVLFIYYSSRYPWIIREISHFSSLFKDNFAVAIHYLVLVQDELFAGGEPEARLRGSASRPRGSLCPGLLRRPLGESGIEKNWGFSFRCRLGICKTLSQEMAKCKKDHYSFNLFKFLVAACHSFRFIYISMEIYNVEAHSGFFTAWRSVLEGSPFYHHSTHILF